MAEADKRTINILIVCHSSVYHEKLFTKSINCANKIVLRPIEELGTIYYIDTISTPDEHNFNSWDALIKSEIKFDSIYLIHCPIYLYLFKTPESTINNSIYDNLLKPLHHLLTLQPPDCKLIIPFPKPLSGGFTIIKNISKIFSLESYTLRFDMLSRGNGVDFDITSENNKRIDRYHLVIQSRLPITCTEKNSLSATTNQSAGSAKNTNTRRYRRSKKLTRVKNK